MFCTGCGNQLPDGATFCPKCGKAVGGGSRKISCPKCGKELKENSSKCEFCGEIIGGSSPLISDEFKEGMKNTFNSAKEKGVEGAKKGAQMLKNGWDAASPEIKSALHSAKEKGAEGAKMLKEEWNDTSCGEFRIVNNQKYLTLIKILSILQILSIPGLCLFLLIRKAEKTYLRDYAVLFIFRCIMGIAISVGGLAFGGAILSINIIGEGVK